MDLRHFLVSEPNIYSLVVYNNAIEFLFVQKSNNKLQKKFFNKVLLPAGVIEKGVLKKPEEFIKAVKSCFDLISKKVLKKQTYIMVSIPDDETFVKRYEFSDSLEKNEINDSIKLNETIQLPFLLEESYYDTEARVLLKKEDWQELLFIQIKKSVIDPYVNALQSINLDVIIVECETLSLFRALDFKLRDPYLMIKEDSGGFSLSFVFDKQLKFFSYRKILNNKETKTDQLTKIIESFLNYLEVEFNTNIQNIIFIDNFQTSNQKFFLDIIKNFKNRDREMKQILFEDIVRADIKTILQKTDNNIKLSTFGLGARTLISREDDKLISLLPVGTEDLYLAKRSVSYIKKVQGAIIFACLFLVILFGGTFAFIKFFIGVNMHKSLQLSLVKVQTSNFTDLENKAKEFNSFLDNTEKANQFKNKISEPLDDFQKMITPGITITGIKGGDKDSVIVVSGISLTREQAIDFQDNLVASEKFYNVELPLASLASDKNVIFQITMKWR